jgi:hypothetical protein
MLEEDANMRYFHSVANGGYRKKLIHSLTHDEGTIEGHEQFKSYITNYYKGLSGDPLESNLSMDESRIDDIPNVPQEEIVLLTDPCSEDEFKKVVFQMEHNKIPGLDGFLAEIYPNFWKIIKSDLMELFSVLHVGQPKLFCINFGEIILLPKVNKAERIQQYISICLLNVYFKHFTKVGAIRMNSSMNMWFAPLRRLLCKEDISWMDFSPCLKQFMSCIVKR